MCDVLLPPGVNPTAVKYIYIISYQNRPVCWSIVVKEKPAVGSQFSGELPSDRIPKATKAVNV
jgi:hypothetical protein